jgi:Matrixin/Putative peptidoglycan binding domain
MTTDDDLPRVEGLKEGDAGQDVTRLQRYLEKFGYLDSPRLEEYGVPREKAAAPPAAEGSFDENTDKALRAFQEKFGLQATGVLDQSTLQLISQPRCGFPDVAEFAIQGNKWKGNAVTYGFNEFTPDLTQPEIQTAIAEAFGLWQAVTPLSFTQVPIASTPDIVIRFAGGDHGDGFPFDSVGGVIAHAFFPPPNLGAFAGDSHFDEAETWSVDLPPSGTDLVTVAAHEFGHALGLGHSFIPGTLMYPFYGGPHRFLHPDDIAGIRAIYDWEDLGGVLTDGVGAAFGPQKPGAPVIELVCFAAGTDRALWLRGWMSGFQWNPWESQGGETYSAPAAVGWGPGRLDVFALGANRSLWHKAADATPPQTPQPPPWPWSEWEDLGGFWTDGVAVSSWAENRLDCFTVGTDRALWHKAWDGSSWSSWESLGGEIYSAPAAVSWGPNRIDAIALGVDRAVWHLAWDGSSWSAWEHLGGFWTHGVGISSRGPDTLDCFTVGTDRALWHKVWNGSAWGAWESLGGEIYSAPAAVCPRPDRIDIFALGANRQMLHKWYAP